MLDPSSAEEVVWRVRPLATPRVLHHCPRCERTRAFVSSDKFRLNARQRRLDVWLLYSCAACQATWKRTLLSRVAPAEIGPDLHTRLQHNDPATAWAYACAPDPVLLFEHLPDVAVERPPLVAGTLRIRLAVPWPCGVRLDRLLAGELGLSRTELATRVRTGRIGIAPLGERALKRPPRDGTRIVLDGA